MNKQIDEIISDICPFFKEYGTCERCNTELDIENEPCYWECIANAIIKYGYRRQDEVAREILTQLEEEIKPLLEKNYRLYTKYLNEQDSQTVLRVGGKIDTLRGIYCFIEELKKKYGVTES